MYFYYFAHSAKIWPRWLSPIFITFMQLVQMVSMAPLILLLFLSCNVILCFITRSDYRVSLTPSCGSCKKRRRGLCGWKCKFDGSFYNVCLLCRFVSELSNQVCKLDMWVACVRDASNKGYLGRECELQTNTLQTYSGVSVVLALPRRRIKVGHTKKRLVRSKVTVNIFFIFCNSWVRERVYVSRES